MFKLMGKKLLDFYANKSSLSGPMRVVSRLSRESLIPCLRTTKVQTSLHSLMSTFVVRFLQGMIAKLATWIAKFQDIILSL